MRTPAIVLTVMLLGCVAAVCCASPPAVESAPASSASLDTLSWLTGGWVHDDAGERTEEHWTTVAGGTLVGMNRTVKAGGTQHFEHLRIERRDDGIYYVASPSNQPSAEFRLIAGKEPHTAVFENTAREDFPQRITYHRTGDTLHARVEGPGAQQAEWTWQRVWGAPLAGAATPPAASKESLFDDGLTFEPPWKQGDAGALGFDLQVLDEIVQRAAETKSDSLLIIHDRRVVVERYFGQPVGPIETMSMTKSIVSLGIGMLIADGKISSIDSPVSTWFPDWTTGLKAKVTLRHILTHTSGLEHQKGAGVLNKQSDRSAFVRKSPVVEEPGATFSYSNEGVQLLAEIAAIAAKEPLDEYMSNRLFAPLGISMAPWSKDEAGNVQTFFGLALSARDLARIGQLMLQQGKWNGEQLVPAAWIEQSTTAAPNTDYHGLLWWIRRGRGHVSIPPEKAEAFGALLGDATAATAIAGQTFSTYAALWLELGSHLNGAARERMAKLIESNAVPTVETPGDPLGFAADGWLGQQLIVLPRHKVIVVRQHRSPEDGSADDAYNQKMGFFDLVKRIERALPAASR